MIGFAIYDLPCSGGTLALSPVPGRTRHYATDWQHLLDWRPDLVITTCELAELARKGSAGLGQDCAAHGIGWAHFPVVDYGTPDGDWKALSDQARAVLASGGRVLVHCFGGCGRSGMTALRLMCDAGEEPSAAFARLRATRPCAVETDAQLVWATGGRLTARPSP